MLWTLLWSVWAASPLVLEDLQNGDVVLQKTRGPQSVAVREATGSPYTHTGLVFMRHGEPWVLEAVQPVRWTQWASWVARGTQQHVAVYRVTDDHTLSAAQQTGLRRAAES